MQYVPPPWPLPPAIHAAERAKARARLGLPANARVVLYAGNLDRYQGWETIAAALARLAPAQPALRWLVGHQSDPAALMDEARRAGIAERIDVRPLLGEAARRTLHAAADIAAVPRRTPGGLPIKLLDAMARGLPCAVVPRAVAGLTLGSAVERAAADDPEALAASLARLIDGGAKRSATRSAGARATTSPFTTACKPFCTPTIASARPRCVHATTRDACTCENSGDASFCVVSIRERKISARADD